MGYHCEVCDKKTVHGNNISHSHRKTKRVWKPNIQHVRVRVNGGIRYMYVCTRCLRSGRVNRAI
ncbi:MAG: 50S ribosomal protein L28 [Firmicutes bacterium]|nr:50S ribosomal protein L28 [Alicyclobacillaceae bacterium]MCL6496427.1 50S ribosomal protein L28 [Bacillota bacterium]